MAEEAIKPTETIVDKKETAEVTVTVPTDSEVIAKVQKGEKLSEEETEIFKSLPKESLPGPTTEDPGKPAAPATKAADAPKKEETTQERRKLIEDELAKPDGTQDLSRFTPTEVGLYYDLRKQRSKNQKLQDELEISRVENIVQNLKSKEKPPEKAAEEEDPLKTILEGMDDGDIPTVGQLKKVVEALKTKKDPAPKQTEQVLRTPEQIRIERVEAAQKLKEKGIEDFAEVIEYAGVVLKDDPDAAEILRDVAKKGGNTVEETYWLIKGHKGWPALEKHLADEKAKAGKTPAKPPAENLERAKRMEENENKIRTTGPSTGAPANAKEYSVSEIAQMTHADIRRMNKETRRKILEKYGSEPNYSV